jgi:prepilin-type N-terminal cleavage/methylation domain-containing protein
VKTLNGCGFGRVQVVICGYIDGRTNAGRSPRVAEQGPRFAERAAGGAVFTLVELLVVVPIIGILAALLLTALSRSRYKVRDKVCLSNIRQVSLMRRDFLFDEQGQVNNDFYLGEDSRGMIYNQHGAAFLYWKDHDAVSRRMDDR